MAGIGQPLPVTATKGGQMLTQGGKQSGLLGFELLDTLGMLAAPPRPGRSREPEPGPDRNGSLGLPAKKWNEQIHTSKVQKNEKNKKKSASKHHTQNKDRWGTMPR